MKYLLWSGVLALCCIACQDTTPTDATANSTSMSTAAAATTIYVGTYTRKESFVDGKAKGIWTVETDPTDGRLRKVGVTAGIINPSFVLVAPAGDFLYAVSETGPDDDSTSYVYAYAIGADQSLTLLNRQATRGFAPCHLTMDRQQRYLFVANYSGGVVMLPIADDGSLSLSRETLRFAGSGPHDRQDASHPHATVLSPDEKYLYICDLGTDKIMSFTIDYAAAKLHPTQPAATVLPPGAGPRHLTFHPSLLYAYVVNELNSTVTALSYEAATGHLQPLGEGLSTLPTDYKGDNTCAEIAVSPDGKYVLASNRGHDSLAAFRIDPDTGYLTLLGHTDTGGKSPRFFAFSPDGRYVYTANQNSDNIVQFAFDSTTGQLQQLTELTIETPVCLAFQPTL